MTDLHGVIDELDEATYHAHAALSSSGARRLLPPSCPARFRWERDNGGRPNRATFDEGHAAHREVLGVGAPLVIIEADDWRTKAAREQRDEAYAQGRTPILAATAEHVRGMAKALREHPLASDLLKQPGRPEVSLFWHDEQHGIDRRARLDWLPEVVDGRVIIADLKTTTHAEPRSIERWVTRFGYHQQAAWYIDAAHALGIAETVDFRLIFVEKEPPYLTTVAELDHEAILAGRALNDRALGVYAECVATDTWPGYTSGIATVSLPSWAVDDALEMSL